MHPLIEDLLQTPYGFHCFIVATVVSSALLVYLCGFKSAVEPPFDKLSYPGADERRQQSAKKKKPKDKKSQSNGHATSVGSDSKKSEQKLSSKKDEKEKSPSKQGGKNSEEKRSPAKNALRETKGSNKDTKKAVNSSDDPANTKARQQGKGKENVEQVKNKKNQVEEKPKDFDDGEWEQAVSRKDKKNRKATLEDNAKDKKKDGKKKNKGNDESGDGDKVSEESKEKSQVLEALAEIGLSTIEVESPASDSSKPKKTKKKKTSEVQPSAGPGTEVVDGKLKQPAQEETLNSEIPLPEVKPQRPAKKQEMATNIIKTEEPASVDPVIVAPAQAAPPQAVQEGSNVVFDELGDAWKEAKVAKKSTKKKTRKD